MCFGKGKMLLEIDKLTNEISMKIKNNLLQNQLLLITVLMCSVNLSAQKYWDGVKNRDATLGLEQGYSTVETANFTLKLVNASQTVAGLYAQDDEGFDFTPGERLEIRDKDSLYHLGDINITLRTNQGSWKSYSSAYHRKEVTPLDVSGAVLAASDMANTFP